MIANAEAPGPHVRALNAIGKPYNANYNSNYKIRKGVLTSIKRLYAPYGPGMFAGDQADEGRKRRRRPRSVPLLERPQMARDLPLSLFMQDLLRAGGMSDDAIAQLTVEQAAQAIANAAPEHRAVAFNRALLRSEP